MKYIINKYFSLTGKKIRVSLSDNAYGEWIIYQAGVPKYHINCFDGTNSGKLIDTLLAGKKESIESIVKK